MAFVSRLGTIVHPGSRVNSGYCINHFRNKNTGELSTVFATETPANWKKSDKYEKTYSTDFVCNCLGLHLSQLESGYYMVGVVLPTCVTLMLCNKDGIGNYACLNTISRSSVQYIEDNTEIVEACKNTKFGEPDVTDIVIMDEFFEAIQSIDEIVADELKDSVAFLLRNEASRFENVSSLVDESKEEQPALLAEINAKLNGKVVAV